MLRSRVSKKANADLKKGLQTGAIDPAAQRAPASSKETAPVPTADSDRPQDEFAELNQAVKKNPKDQKVLRQLAEGYISQDRFNEAIPHLSALVKLQPKNAEMQYLLGNTFYKAQKFEDSLPPLYKAVRLDPKLAKAHYGLCIVNELVGQEDAASKHYKIAMKLDPNVESSV